LPLNGNKSVDKNSTTDEGIIHVCEDVIVGYGGHGTIVYKVLLDGRQVAVKTMPDEQR
jgi:hypothetical protein